LTLEKQPSPTRGQARRCESRRPAPREQGSRAIQLPYPNTYETIWEYRESFLSGRIDFPSLIGPACPICGHKGCYREITPYWRYAMELFPAFEKKRIPIARFLCRRQPRTFSLLPLQLIPYCRYTANAILGTLLLGLECRSRGQRGFHGAVVRLDPESLVTPWLVACWTALILRGLRRAHAVLRRWYDLSRIRTSGMSRAWEEIGTYFLCLGWKSHLPFRDVFHRYSRSTRHFLFGTPSQERAGC
jgi:hypothetical protein